MTLKCTSVHRHHHHCNHHHHHHYHHLFHHHPFPKVGVSVHRKCNRVGVLRTPMQRKPVFFFSELTACACVYVSLYLSNGYCSRWPCMLQVQVVMLFFFSPNTSSRTPFLPANLLCSNLFYRPTPPFPPGGSSAG